MWDARIGTLVHRLEGHKRYVTSCAFSDDNQLLATGSCDQTVIIWNIDSLEGKESISIDTKKGATEAEVNGSGNGSKEAFSSDKYVGEWTEAEVGEWVASLGPALARYAATFRDHHLDGLELLHLTHDSLLMNLRIGLPRFARRSLGALLYHLLTGSIFFLFFSIFTIIEPLGDRNKILRAIMTLKNPLWQQLAEDELNSCRRPAEFCCPITQDLMTDPVVAADGSTYERAAITKWIFEGNCTSPMTNDLLHDHQLTPNLNLRSLIQKYQMSFGHSVP